MQRLEIIENKMATKEQIEELDKKIHNHITQFGSKVGNTLKELKGKDTMFNEKVELGFSRIDKMEEVMVKMGSAFSPPKTKPSTPQGGSFKSMYVPKDNGVLPIKRNEDLKMIRVHTDFINTIKDPIVKTPKKHACIIEELDVKDDNT